MPAIVLLGPQRLKPTLATALAAAGVDGPVAAVTAGWEEREDEIENLRAHVPLPVVNLRLHARAEDVFRTDREFFLGYLERRRRLHELQDLYRLRLGHLVKALRELLRRRGDRDLLKPERAAALADLRRLDAHQVRRIAEVHAGWEERWRPAEREALARHRRAVETLSRNAAAFAVAGGNVAILLNRLRLFGFADLAARRPVFAWSAGAMAVAERIVLYHDRPPQGPSHPEVFGDGLGLCRGVVPLPHARRRLRLDDALRVGMLARRFAPLRCVAMDDGSALSFDRGAWSAAQPGTWRLTPKGGLEEFPAA